MLKILIVEGNSPELMAHALAHGQASNAKNDGEVLHSISHSEQFEIFQPFLTGGDLDTDYLNQFDGAAFTGADID